MNRSQAIAAYSNTAGGHRRMVDITDQIMPRVAAPSAPPPVRAASPERARAEASLRAMGTTWDEALATVRRSQTSRDPEATLIAAYGGEEAARPSAILAATSPAAPSYRAPSASPARALAEARLRAVGTSWDAAVAAARAPYVDAEAIVLRTYGRELSARQLKSIEQMGMTEATYLANLAKGGGKVL